MNRIAGLCLLAAVIAIPLSVRAQTIAPTAQGSVCPARKDVIAIEKDLDTLSGEMITLTASLKEPGQQAAAVKVQEKISKVAHRVRQLQEQMDGAGSGLVALKQEVPAPDKASGK